MHGDSIKILKAPFVIGNLAEFAGYWFLGYVGNRGWKSVIFYGLCLAAQFSISFGLFLMFDERDDWSIIVPKS